MQAIRNTFENLPYIPYNIVEYLINSDKAENLWKILKYPTYDCLSEDNLTLDEKASLIYKNQPNQQDYNVFLIDLVENMIPEEKTILKIYRVGTSLDTLYGIGLYRFDVLFGGKIGMIEYNDMPCNRGDVVEMELLKCLNGAAINGGAGYLEYSKQLTRSCGSALNLGNSTTYTGFSIIMGMRLFSINDTGCSEIY